MIMPGPVFRFVHDVRAVAAAEMALMTPLLLLLMFGSVEVGKYFLDAHVVAKSVRDGARYAARQSFSDFPGCSPSAAVIANTRNLTRTGEVSGGYARLSYWTDGDSTIDVTSTCASGYEGIYSQVGMGAPVVTVAASVPYSPLLNSFGFQVGLFIRVQSQAAVTGI